MSSTPPHTDPLEFVKNMWGNMGFSLPGMVTPTLDTDELEKRITDMKAVEGWLRMNLSMLQMTIQGMEMQHATLTAVRAMGNMASQASSEASQGETGAAAGAAAEAAANAFSQAAMWPWNMMNQVQEHMQQQAADQASATEPPPAAKKAAAPEAKSPSRRSKKSQ
ncbi:MAG: hypothetical protein KGN39_01875 [Betaproteobacteria bacterium]|nr:hypothetical protein [Betaproteobacteria bacterium]